MTRIHSRTPDPATDLAFPCSRLRSYGRLQASKSSLTISVSAFGFGGSDTTEDSSSEFQGYNRSSNYLGRQSELAGPRTGRLSVRGTIQLV